MKEKKIIIDDIEIQRGTRVRINIDMGRMHDFTDLKMPIEVVSGVQDGPTLFVSSTIHGDEIIGIEIVRRILEKIDINFILGLFI